MCQGRLALRGMRLIPMNTLQMGSTQCWLALAGYLRGVLRGAQGQAALGIRDLGIEELIPMPWKGYLRGVVRGAPGQHALGRRARAKAQAPQLVPVAAVQPEQLACATRCCL